VVDRVRIAGVIEGITLDVADAVRHHESEPIALDAETTDGGA
jgi:hypothetical protein